jgi:hypothetical protein
MPNDAFDIAGSFGDTQDVDTLTRPQKAEKPPFLTDLVGDQEVTSNLAGLKRQEIAEKDAAQSDMTRLLERDQRRVEQQYAATGIQPGEFKKWDAEAETKKHTTEPLQAFGSLGSVFGILASAFTHAPMENALNASAAAMNAIKAGDEQAHERAHTAWKENTDLAFKRHEMQRQSYQDAITLMNTNLQVGEAKLKMLASKYGDQQTLALLDAGLSKEVIDLQEKRADAAVKMMDARNRITENGMQQEVLRLGIKQNEKIQDPQQRAAADLALLRDTTFTKPKDFEMTAMSQAQAESIRQKGRPLTYDEMLEKQKGISESKRAGMSQSARDAEETDRRAREIQTSEGGTYGEAYLKARAEIAKAAKPAGTGAGRNTNLTIDRQNAAEVARQKEEWRKDGMPEAEIAERGAKLAAHLRSAATPITSTRKDDLASQITRFQLASEKIDQVEALLKKHNAMTGLGGKITRPAEAVGNAIGYSNETDRAQFLSYISELQDWGPRLLNEAKSRPLSAEEKRISAIVPGLSLGDTTKNTADRLLELQKLFRKMQDQMTQRYEGTWTPPKGDIPAGEKPAGKAPWSRDPMVAPGKRSAIESEEEAA